MVLLHSSIYSRGNKCPGRTWRSRASSLESAQGFRSNGRLKDRPASERHDVRMGNEGPASADLIMKKGKIYATIDRLNSQNVHFNDQFPSGTGYNSVLVTPTVTPTEIRDCSRVRDLWVLQGPVSGPNHISGHPDSSVQISKLFFELFVFGARCRVENSKKASGGGVRLLGTRAVPSAASGARVAPRGP